MYKREEMEMMEEWRREDWKKRRTRRDGEANIIGSRCR